MEISMAFQISWIQGDAEEIMGKEVLEERNPEVISYL